ncbi:hypothetical protein HN51_002303 [Arachis hypogaea]
MMQSAREWFFSTYKKRKNESVEKGRPLLFFLASRICTQILMSRLLPIPYHHKYPMLLDEDEEQLKGWS